MKLTNYMHNNKTIMACASLMVSTALAMLTACKEVIEVPVPVYTVGEADNAIVLTAGISEGGSGVQTRAGENPDANHSSHVLLKEGTSLTLRVYGVWKGKADGSLNHGSISSGNVSQTTTAAIGSTVAETDNKHNKVTFTPSQQLYWDDYGSADPNNMSEEKGGKVSDGSDGRGRGLDIFAVIVDGVTSETTVSSWTALPWSLDADQKNGWSTKDLLTSNNVKKTNDAKTNPYKFDAHNEGKLLEFTHAMTKVTVELTAGAGFPTGGTPASSQFQQQPSVTLLGFYYTGTYNVETKTSTANAGSKTNISAHLAEVETTSSAEWSNAPATWAKCYKAKYDALVFPGNSFTATIAAEEPYTSTSTDEILEINADGNIYKVTAAQLVKAIVNSATGSQTGTLEQAKNYVLKITVNKTGIDKIEATVKDWVNVEAENDAPKINIVTNYGDPTIGGTNPTISAFTKEYTFLRSLNNPSGAQASDIGHGYGENRWMKYESSTYKMYDESTYNTESPLYWPDHSCHYFFRGVYPRLGVSGDGVPVKNTITVGEKSYDVIAVSNEKYTHDEENGHCPTDLLIAYPHPYDETDGYSKTCRHSQDIATNGICATEGKIVMNFEHVMSQVEVKLTTNTADGAANKVIFDGNTKVEIIGGYSSGYILLKDGSANFHSKLTADYTMNREHDSGDKVNKEFLDAIIPQSLVDGSGKPTLKFKITVKSTNSAGDSNFDEYETVMGIKDIKVTESGITQSGTIEKWEPGKKYIYTLNITKTGIVSTATIKDWEEVNASQDVWF